MHISYNLFLGAMWQTIASKPFRIGKVVGTSVWAIGFLVFEFFTWICLQLDRLLYPGFEAQAVQAPVFLVGNPRSGTSFFYRLMAMDKEVFTTFSLGEIVFPAITQQKLLALQARADSALGSPLRRLFSRVEERVMACGDHIRRTRWSEPEEDDLVLIHKFASATLLMLFPFAKILAPIVRHDDLPSRTRQDLDRFYLSCVQRHMHLVGGNRRLLSKNTSFPGKVRSLREAFPDARFVYLLRNPVVSIASMQDMFDKTWSMQLTPEQRKDHGKRVFTTACYLYSHALTELDRLPSSSWCVVQFEDLVADPEGTVRNVYKALGLHLSPAFEAKLKKASIHARNFKSKHAYMLRWVTEEEVHEALVQVFVRFSFKEKIKSSGPEQGAAAGGSTGK